MYGYGETKEEAE